MKFKCRDCQVQFDTNAKLKYHRQKCHGSARHGLDCHDCGQRFSSRSNLNRHRIRIHEPESVKESKWICSTCGHSCQDKFHLEIHERKHKGERPFVCQGCQFGFYKKSDLTLHRKGCRGPQYKCQGCDKVFHFKRQLTEHSLWSATCGRISKLPQEEEHSNQRYMTETPNVVRLNISKNKSVIGVNCDDFIDPEVVQKRKRRKRCGICPNCEREESCSECSACLGQSKKKKCLAKRCLNLIDQYNVKKVMTKSDELKTTLAFINNQD